MRSGGKDRWDPLSTVHAVDQNDPCSGGRYKEALSERSLYPDDRKSLESGFELLQKAHVVLREETQIFYVVFEHGDALDAHAERIAAVVLAIDLAVFEHGRINHAAAHDFEPAGVLAH